jgi:cell division inhibitor SepF
MWDKIKSLFTIQEEDEYVEAIEVPVRGEDGSHNIISLHPKAEVSHEVVVMHPKSFNETLAAVSFLKLRSTVVINVTKMSENESQRFVDFISGSAYALDGYQERVGEGIFVLTPSHIGIRSRNALSTADGLAARG